GMVGVEPGHRAEAVDPVIARDRRVDRVGEFPVAVRTRLIGCTSQGKVSAAVVTMTAGAAGSVRGLLVGVVDRPGVAGLPRLSGGRGLVGDPCRQPMVFAADGRGDGNVARLALLVPCGVDGGHRAARETLASAGTAQQGPADPAYAEQHR